ncbi:YqhA family protein [Microcoleus sp. LEGE 07076]|uniref:YqhA family protein n=1 Tax=Microcoleus sp. LEGE 07076 TaxID=915322 RepID=UPI0018800CBB|nr:YqhA family protein [Microcoleus sp. LEGE 07076]MBE9183383.1 YqhA family protein [Microcoleus sp. LEGE 07076]
MLHRILAKSRYLMLIAVIGSFAASVTLLIYGALETITTIAHTTTGSISSENSKKLILSCVEVVDLFLLATVFYITALGLYELFIDERIKVPIWLEIHTIDDLKTKLTSVIVVVLSVLFLAEVVRWNGATNILPLGASIALVIASLTYFLSSQVKKTKSD